MGLPEEIILNQKAQNRRLKIRSMSAKVVRMTSKNSGSRMACSDIGQILEVNR